jgi:5'-deoxynucleotidase YfbR-like HD superfamily hydrolase
MAEEVGEMVGENGRAWQRMLSGRRLDILSPSPLDVEIEDIATGLSRLARWNGQTNGIHAYSVAQHSILVMELLCAANPNVSDACLLAALLHDAPEYVTSDLITPFKNAIGDSYRKIERDVSEAVHVAFGLPAELPTFWQQMIHKADRMAAAIEAVHLAGFSRIEVRKVFGIPGQIPFAEIDPWDAPTAKQKFLATFKSLIEGKLWSDNFAKMSLHDISMRQNVEGMSSLVMRQRAS